MRILITGSAGHLGEALMRTLADSGHEAIGLDIRESPYTRIVGSIGDRSLVRGSLSGVDAVLHTATLHKPHVATHRNQDFIDTNVTGMLNLLEAAAEARVGRFVFTSTTSVFGHALTPPPGTPAAWITESVTPLPKNIYGITKLTAESLCELVHRRRGLPCLILRTSRFFPEGDDDHRMRESFADQNLKVNEFLYRRADVEDIVSAHLLALEAAPRIGFGRYIVSATTPFMRDDAEELGVDAPAVLRRRVPEYEPEYARRGWSMLPALDRVYVNDAARAALGWRPRYDFAYVLNQLRAREDFRSPLARAVGSKGYDTEVFADGPYPTD